MKLILRLVLWASLVRMLAQPSPVYVNVGNDSSVPQLDTLVFINQGSFTVSASPFQGGGIIFGGLFLDQGMPYQIQNLQFLTNFGTIAGSPGMDFRNIPASGLPGFASVIYNAVGAVIDAQGSGVVFPDPDGNIDPFRAGFGGLLTLEATNIISRGSLSSSFVGDLRLRGLNVDLASSIVRQFPAPALTATNQPPTGADFGIQGFWWNLGEDEVATDQMISTQVVTTVTPLLDGSSITNTVTNLLANLQEYPVRDFFTPDDAELDDLPVQAIPVFTPPNPNHYFIRTNQVNETNEVVTVLLVQTASTSLLVNASFGAGQVLPIVNVSFGVPTTNIVTGNVDVEGVRIQSSFGLRPDATNYSSGFFGEPIPGVLGIRRQRITVPITLADIRSNRVAEILSFTNLTQAIRPAGNATNSAYRTDLFTTTTFAELDQVAEYTEDLTKSNRFTAFAFEFNTQPANVDLPNVPNISATNTAGRINVEAASADLRGTRIRAEAMINLKLDDFVTSGRTAFDAPVANLDLGDTEGDLQVRNIIPANSGRLGGTVSIYSTVWTNTLEVEIEGPPDEEGNTETETVGLSTVYHVMIVDAALVPDDSSSVINLNVRSREVTMDDDAVVATFRGPQTEVLTLNGNVELEGVVVAGVQQGTISLTKNEFPLLNRLVVDGSLVAGNVLNFGQDRTNRLESITGEGFLIAEGIYASAQTIDFPGFIAAGSGPAELSADGISLVQGISAGSYLKLTGNSLLTDGATFLAASAPIQIHIRDLWRGGGLLLSDSGVEVLTKPIESDIGSLLVELNVPNFYESTVVWPAEDRGASLTGYENNVAIDNLTLNGGLFSGVRFSGPGGQGSLYVNSLTISESIAPVANGILDLDYLADGLSFNGQFVLYYQSASAGTNDISAALDGALDGRLRRVAAPVGEGSVTPVNQTYVGANGKPTAVSRGLLLSAALDSDGDGIVNALDMAPFEGADLKIRPTVAGGKQVLELSWQAAANTTYAVEYVEHLGQGEWQTLAEVKNTAASAKRMVTHAAIREGDPARLFRIVYRP
jgi:hypothetical protein